MKDGGSSFSERIAAWCYKLADAMIAEREKA